MQYLVQQLRRLVGISFLLTWISVGIVHSQTTKQAPTTGVRFLTGSLQQAIAAAKTAHKPLFVEVYLTGCPHCEALAPIFTEKQVGDFYNATFISWKTEANSQESKNLQNTKGIAYLEFPVMLFLDSGGNVIHLATPSERTNKQEFIDQVIQLGRTALNPQQRTAGYATRFQSGERKLDFLIDFAKHCKTVKDTAQLHQITDALNTLLVLPQDRTSLIGFYVLQRLTDDIDSPLATYFFTHLSEFSAKYQEKDVKEAGEGIIFRTLYGPKGDTYPATKVVQMRDYMVTLGVPANEAAPRTLLKELDAHLRARNTTAAVERFNDYRKQVPSLKLPDYAYLMHYFNEKATDNSYLSFMPIWAADGLKLTEPSQQTTKQVADLYYELALAYQKLGQKSDALTNAQKGADVARKAKLDPKRYEDQIASLK